LDIGGLILGVFSVSSYCPEPERERERLTVGMGYFEGLGFLEAF
jgi:hypothetical protein